MLWWGKGGGSKGMIVMIIFCNIYAKCEYNNSMRIVILFYQ